MFRVVIRVDQSIMSLVWHSQSQFSKTKFVTALVCHKFPKISFSRHNFVTVLQSKFDQSLVCHSSPLKLSRHQFNLSLVCHNSNLFRLLSISAWVRFRFNLWCRLMQQWSRLVHLRIHGLCNMVFMIDHVQFDMGDSKSL